MCVWHSQFNGFVPHDGISWEGKGLHIHNVDVSSFCADVQPFTLEGQMTERYPAIEECRESKLFVFVIYKRTEPLPYFLPRKASYVSIENVITFLILIIFLIWIYKMNSKWYILYFIFQCHIR